MRKLIGVFVVALTALVAVPFAAQAQMSLGVGGGLVSATFVGDDVADLSPESVTGFSFGAWLGIPLGGRLSVAPGAHYVQKGVSGTEPGVGTAKFALSYLEIPVLLSVRLTPDDSSTGFSIFAGPSVAFEVGCTLEASDGTVTASADCDDADADERETLDIGALLGAGVQFPLNESLALMFSGGVDLGLRTLDASTDPDDIKNRAFFGSVAAVIPIGG